LNYRQSIHDLERLVTWEGFIPRKKRQRFQRFLEHENERVRAYAEEIAAAGALACAEERLYRDLDEALMELREDDFSPSPACEAEEIAADVALARAEERLYRDLDEAIMEEGGDEVLPNPACEIMQEEDGGAASAARHNAWPA